MKPSTITTPLLSAFPLAFLLLTMQACLSCAAVSGAAARDSPPYMSLALSNSSSPSRVSHPLMVWDHLSRVEVSIAAQYGPPYKPTACFGNDPAQFPSNGIFAAAGEKIWDNKVVCGRYFLVQCIGASVPGTCISGQTIQVRIVDRALSSSSRPSISGAAIVLSMPAFSKIANPSAKAINVEYQRI